MDFDAYAVTWVVTDGNALAQKEFPSLYPQRLRKLKLKAKSVACGQSVEFDAYAVTWVVTDGNALELTSHWAKTCDENTGVLFSMYMKNGRGQVEWPFFFFFMIDGWNAWYLCRINRIIISI